MAKANTPLPPHLQLFLLILWPPLLGLLFAALVSNFGGPGATAPLFLGGLGAVGWALGVRWYGPAGLGLRGGRPLWAGIGFAVLGWVALLLARFMSVRIILSNTGGLGLTYLYLLLFEAACVQVWAFGAIFRALAAWRSPLTAAIGSGLIYGLTAYAFFGELYRDIPLGLLFTAVWGLFYGIIRLRTGSLLGTVLVQSVQSFTVWYMLAPPADPLPSELNRFYLMSALLLALFIWRLWPRRDSDHRV